MSITSLLEERQKTHGSFHDHATYTVGMKDIMALSGAYKNGIPEHREALDMIVHKIGRILAGDPNHKDHWDDIAGYATLGALTCEK